MICVLVLAAGHPWESSALSHLDREAGIAVMKRCVDVDDLLAAAMTGQADVALVALDAPGLDQSAVTHLQRHAVPTVVVTQQAATDVDSLEAARRLGAETVVGLEQFPALGEALSRAAVNSSHTAPAAEPHRVTAEVAGPGPDAREDHDRVGGRRTIAVFGAAGAPGRTTVALNLAAELARRGRQTVLVDLDPYGGSVGQQLGILDEVSGVLAGARLAASGHLSDRFASTCRLVDDGLSVVTGLPRADRWREVRAAHVDEVLAQAAGHGDVIVDTGFSLEEDGADLAGRGSRNAMTLGALEVADEIVVVGAADPVGLARLARSLVELQERFGSTPVRVVVNRMRPSIGWSEREVAAMVEGFLHTSGLHFLPEDRVALDRALLAGRAAVVMGESAFSRGIAALADAALPASVVAASQGRGWLPRPRTGGQRGRQAAKSR